jgi:hypothetical protein
MALSAKSLINYGLIVDSGNRYINYKLSSGGIEKTATLNLGYYSLTTLATEIVRAFVEADDQVSYAVTINRNVSGGLENRITISCSSTYFSLLFGTGTNAGASLASLIGFNYADYTGSQSYTGSSSSGVALVPEMIGYNYLGTDLNQEIQGSRSISAGGIKEAIVFQIMEFIQVEYKYEPSSRITEWKNFLRWAIQQRPFDFIPEISNTTINYDVTLDRAGRGQNGMGYVLREMLPQFPNFYTTGQLEFRKNVSLGAFI